MKTLGLVSSDKKICNVFISKIYFTAFDLDMEQTGSIWTIIEMGPMKIISAPFGWTLAIVGRICNNFEKNRALYDKSMKLGTWLVDNKTKK